MSGTSTSRRSERRAGRGSAGRRSILGRRKGRHEAASHPAPTSTNKRHGSGKKSRAGGAPGRSRRRHRFLVAVPLMVGVLAVGGWWTTHSAIFSARHVEVRGAIHLTRAEVLGAAGITTSTNLLWADPGAVEEAVESNSWVADATVTRSLPSSMTINVTERRAASTVVVGKTWFLVATDGTILGPAKHRPDLPVLPPVGAVTVGGRNSLLTDSARIAGGLAPWLRSRVATVGPGDDGAVQIGLDDGVRVLFGPPVDVEAKSQALVGILKWAQDRHDRLATIDVRSPVAPSAVPFGSIEPDQILPPRGEIVNG